MKIREANFEDIEYIIKSINKITDHEIASWADGVKWWIDTNSDRADYAKSIVSEDEYILILEEDWNKIWFLSGYIITNRGAFWKYEKMAMLDFIFVEDKFRWKWGANILNEWFEEWSKWKWVDRIILSHVPWNILAENFYYKNWYEKHLIYLWKNI